MRQITRQFLERVLIVLLVPFMGSVMMAQHASLGGTVTDPNAGVITGVEVTLLNLDAGFRRSTLTGEEGRYLFSLIAPGTYELRAEAPGFKETVVSRVELGVDSALRLDLRLELGEVTESVTVSGRTSFLNSIDATLGKNFRERQISQLPLDSRNVANLLTLQPGVTPQGEVSGARRDQSNLTLDGIDVNDQQQPGAQPGLDPATPGSPLEFQPVLRVTPDSIQEFRVTVSHPLASQGRSSGGQVSLISKAGSNDWHGSLYAYHRNTVTTANDFFNNRVGIERPVLLRNLFGGAVGGPIVTDKAFFFFNYEGRRDRSESSVIRTVPLPHLGQGQVRYISEATGQTLTSSRADIQSLYPATGGVNPIAIAVFADAAARYPGNDNGAGDQINATGFRFNSSIPLNQNTYIARLDLNLGTDHSLFVRGNYQWDRQSEASALPDTPAPAIWSHPTGLAVGHTWQISPSLTNTFRYGLTRQAYSRLGDTHSNFIGFREVYGRSLNQTDSARVTPTHNYTNDTALVKNTHTIQLGANIRIIQNRRTSFANAFDSAITNAFFYYPQELTGGLSDLSSGSDESYRHAIAAVLGRLNQYTARFTFDSGGSLQPVGTPSARSFATEEYDFYIDDSWQIAQDLTLNLGLRYALNTPVRETTGFQVTPTVSLGTFLERRLAGAKAGMPFNDLIEIDTSGPFYGKRGFYETDKNNFMPRISAAWSPSFSDRFLRTLFGSNGRSVFRGGFAMTYDRVGSQLAVSFDRANTLGYNSATTTAATTFNLSGHLAPLFTGFSQDVRSLPEIRMPGRLTFPLTKPPDNARRIEGALDDTIQTPVNYSWNFSIGREFKGGLFVEATYVGRRARNLFATRDIMHPNNLVDPVSGQSFYQAARILQDLRAAETPIDQIPSIPFIEAYFTDTSKLFYDNLTASQNAYVFVAKRSVGGFNALDWTYFQDVMNNRGRIPNLFFHPQYGAFMAFGSIAKSDYHGFTLTAQERFRESLSVDFNYTWSKSFDTASGLQNASLTGAAALILNPLHPEYEYSVSDFDTNHIVNANWLYSFPFGRGRRYGAGMPGAMASILGGWSINGVLRYNSGRPVRSPVEAGRWNTNWQIPNGAIRIRDPLPAPTKNGIQPNFWTDSQYAYNSFRDTYAGEVGDRNVFRRSSYFVLDLGLHKSFPMPYDGSHSLVLRWEVFNVTNTQALGPPTNLGIGVDPEISAQRPNFGVITEIQGVPRVMQFGLRFEF